MIAQSAGHPNYSASGNTGFIPELWSSRFNVKFYPKTVFNEIANTEFEGEIKSMGDKVLIPVVPDGEVKTYTKGMTLTYEDLESDMKELSIDYAEFFGCKIDDIDKYQSHLPLMDKWADDYAQKMKIKIDTNILGSIYADVHASNKGLTAGVLSSSVNLGVAGTPFGLTKTNVIEKIVEMGLVLDEQNVPDENRYIVLPSWACALIKLSDLKDASLTGDNSSLLRMPPNGRLGIIDRFTVYNSNNIVGADDGGNVSYHGIFGHISALTFAAQMTKTEPLTLESTFGTALRGLQVYGFEVIKSEALGDFYIYKG